MVTPEGFRRERLDNGLTVLLRPMNHAPVASFWVWYRVGSRMERRPQTGLTHWVEHMLFRGTERFPGDSVHKLVSREGGTRNGFTSTDYTAYFETLPAERFDLALQLEADRMLNARFRAEDVEAERTIILSERAGRENHASFRLQEAMNATAFPDHGYGHSVIGTEADLKRITRDELWQHYQTYYGPNNAIAVAAGAFDSDALLARLVELFGRDLGRHVQPPADGRRQPPPTSHQRVCVTGNEPTPYVHLMFPAVEGTHPDYFPLLVMDTILGGAKSMRFSGGSGGNRTSRLYRALVDTDLAAGVGSGIRATVDPSAFAAGATVRQGVDPQAVEEVLWAELARVAGEPVSEAELLRARKQTLAQFAYSADSISSQAYWLGFSEIVASAEWFFAFPEHLLAVTQEDVIRVAATYLQPERAVVGWYVPQDNGRDAAGTGLGEATL